jgi:hypothetical protein
VGVRPEFPGDFLIPSNNTTECFTHIYYIYLNHNKYFHLKKESGGVNTRTINLEIDGYPRMKLWKQ